MMSRTPLERVILGALLCPCPEVMLSSPMVIHVLRPYANEDEYLAHERAHIDSKSMLLIDQPALPLETPIVFDVQLANGQKPIRAEAKVIGYVAAGDGNHPGGVRVRFTRFGAATKAFIDRAVAASAAVSRAPHARCTVVAPLPAVSGAPSASVEPALAPAAEPAPPTPPAQSEARDVNESSGVHCKVVLPVSAPVNRDALLARLRGRVAG
jgi:hypothetical protein